MSVKKNILLISWTFPPNSGIGGRRWAKYCKALSLNGHSIQVIKSKTELNDKNSVWSKDIDFIKINVIDLEVNWAVKWLHDYSSKFKVFKIRLAKLYLSIIEKGTIFDKAIGVKNQLINKAVRIIEESKIDIVIVTGAPFNLIYYTAFLKEKFKNVKFIADYRDPWINSVNYGMLQLNEKRRNEEKKKQDFVFDNFDVITAPNEFLLDEIKTFLKVNRQLKFVSLEHFYDMDDVVNVVDKSSRDNLIKIIYAGALYSDTDKYLSLLAKSIRYININSTLKIKLDIFTDHRTKVFNLNGVEDNVTIQNNIGDKVFNHLHEYDFILILLSDHNMHFKTTKFYDFLPYKIPYLYVGPIGFVARSIKEEGLGEILEAEEDLLRICKDGNPTYYGFNEIEKFSLSSRAKQLQELFI